MHIEYENEKVKKLFTDFNLMIRKIGGDRARLTKNRIDQLKASKTFSIYLTTGLGKPHPLYENLKGYYGVTITDHIRLIIRPDAESTEPEDLQRCDTVIIKGVMDYHGRKNEWIVP